ncbi:alpha/beta hydrolase [Rhodospirillaceae bacterium KN72]|uniref:Alpha/beta hydrolase n=2 Tax=Pacificispira spongiicola TaxID=2729598 RepID=A0A7Y0E1E7_9PROT|nr:alpha/beta hydrolase [Pacificispira spongiicola]
MGYHVLLSALFLMVAATASAETVRIDGPAGPLAGEMIAVDGARHAVVIVPGSGPTDSDGNGKQMGLHSDTYKLLAEGLAGAGIASIRIDKRGFFGSRSAIADPNDVTVAAYAQDTRDWVRRAADLAPCVWIAGHSEGGLVALLAAQEPPENLCGLILLAAAGRPIGRLLVDQMRAMPGNAPFMPQIEAAVSALEAGHIHDPAALPPFLRPMFTAGLQRYMIDLFSYDPTALARDWAGPALIVQGDADMQIKPKDADLLATAMPQAVRADLTGATHMLKDDVPGQPFVSYTDPSLPLHAGLIPAITAFLND